jgi:hypothetical protein
VGTYLLQLPNAACLRTWRDLGDIAQDSAVELAGQAQQSVCAVRGEKYLGCGVGVAVEVGSGGQFGFAAEHYPV